ncbi:MAG: peptide chain release factor-like protein [Phycisphaeraceae bacterium]|nr:hypothetical protein [Phycisphaerales bacterium]MCB9844336.1 peptide chain release factor-like protein [Phycisphaeraceae bacterium]
MTAILGPWPHPACLDDDTLLAQCAMGKGRSGGPGGQHRNKVETLVILTHKPTSIEAHAGERRSVMENKRVALKRLRLKLAVEHRTAVPLGDIGSALWRSRLLRQRDAQGKTITRISCNPGHRDYPSLLAEAMDVIDACAFDLTRAGIRLDVSASQLVKLLREHPAALVRVNEQRKAMGERPLR